MKKKTLIFLSIMVTAAIAAFIYFRSQGKAQAISLVTAKAQYGYIAKTATATGSIEPVDTVSIGAQISGVIQKVYVDFNSAVKAGQLLAKIDPSITTAQVEQSKANLANAKSNLDYQQKNFDRQNQLFDLGAISKADYQIALNQYNSSKATVENAAAQLKLAEKNLYYTDIFSPINGVVLNRNVSAGQTIASSFNAPTLFVIAKDLTKMQVWAEVDEADIGGVKPGQHVTFTVDAFPDDIFNGIVQKILLKPMVTANVVTYTTLINVDNTQMKLKPGMTASINIYLQEDTNALLIPSKALNFKPDSSLLKVYKIQKTERDTGAAKINHKNNVSRTDTANNFNNENTENRKSFVWIRSGDTLTEKKIITGLNDDSYVEVIKGLLPGQEVIINAIQGENKNNSGNTQHSPFMPQMGRRPGSRK